MVIRLKKYYILPGHGQIDFGGKVLTRTRHAALCISDSLTALSMRRFLQRRGRRTLPPMKTKERRGQNAGEERRSNAAHQGFAPSPTQPGPRHQDPEDVRHAGVRAAVQPPPPPPPLTPPPPPLTTPCLRPQRLSAKMLPAATLSQTAADKLAVRVFINITHFYHDDLGKK